MDEYFKDMLRRSLWLYFRARLPNGIFEDMHVDRCADLTIANIDTWITELCLGGDEIIREEPQP